MHIEVTDDRERNRFLISEDGETVGLTTYRLHGNLVELLHTEVDPDHGGRGLAGILARAVLDAARARGLEVLPSCPYVAEFIGRHRDEYLDLVPVDRRSQFGFDA